MRARLHVLFILASSACGVNTPGPQHAGAASTAPGAFDDKLVTNVPGSGCSYEHQTLTQDSIATSGKTVATLGAEYTRSWPATLNWEQASGVSGDTLLTLTFSDIQGASSVTPKRQGNAANETACEEYIELRGSLHLQTADGRWDLAVPASVQVQSTGSSVIRLTDSVSTSPFKTWAPDVNPADTASLFSELTNDRAAGELVVRSADGTRAISASWR